MLRLIVIAALIGIVYVLGTMVLSGATTFINDASLIVSGINRSEVKRQVRAYLSEEMTDSTKTFTDADIKITTAHINTDTKKDIIATTESDATCGTGGCITVILLKNDLNRFEFIPFKYTVKSIYVEGTITNGMHDLKINNKSTRMVWDGEQYVMQTQ